MRFRFALSLDGESPLRLKNVLIWSPGVISDKDLFSLIPTHVLTPPRAWLFIEMAAQQHVILLWCYIAEIPLNWLFSHLRPMPVWSDCSRQSTTALPSGILISDLSVTNVSAVGCSMQMKTYSFSLKPCSVCLQQREFPLKTSRQLCRLQQFLFVAAYGFWGFLLLIGWS